MGVAGTYVHRRLAWILKYPSKWNHKILYTLPQTFYVRKDSAAFCFIATWTTIFWKKLCQFLCSTLSCYFNGKTLHFLKEVFFQWIIANPNSNRKIQPTLNAPPIFFVVCKNAWRIFFLRQTIFKAILIYLIHEYAVNQNVHAFREYIWNVSKRPWNVLAPYAICGQSALHSSYFHRIPKWYRMT